MQLGELRCQHIGNRCLLVLIHIGGQTDTAESEYRTGDSHRPVDVRMETDAVGRNELAERQPAAKHGDGSQHDQRDIHRGRSLMRGMGSMTFRTCLILGQLTLVMTLTPEDYVVQTEHIESRHGGNTTHDDTHHRGEMIAGYQDLILREEAAERPDTGDSQTRDEEGNMGNGHILAQATHVFLLITVHGVDDATRTEEQTSLEHCMCEQVEHTGHVTQSALISISLGHRHRSSTAVGQTNT